MKVESLCPFYCFIFLLLVFSSLLDVSVSSKVSRPSFTASLLADLSLTTVSQEFVSMFMDFRSRLQMSLNPSCGLPPGRFPSASSPYRMSFGICIPSFYKHAPAIAGVAVLIESTCLADLLSQEPQCWERLARRCSKYV